MRTAADAEWAFARYQAIRQRLPNAMFPTASRRVSSLSALFDEFDAFVFDAFGVLNVGESPIAGAADCIRALRNAGKRVYVLTNAASAPLRTLTQKYATLGFDFTIDEIVSSRWVMSACLGNHPEVKTWAVAAPVSADIGELPCMAIPLEDDAFAEADGIILLSSSGWTDKKQGRLLDALAKRPRPVLVGNPDLVAPRETGFSREPGSFAHEIWDQLGIEPEFFGKPYGNAFRAVVERAGDLPPSRMLMLGDTLHTDILGGTAAGLKTGLVTGHGVLRSLDVDECIAESGIVPDFILPTI